MFQKSLEQALVGLSGVYNIHDDIIVVGEGRTVKEAELNHDERMLALLTRCTEKNITLNSAENKFICKTTELQYMGHVSRQKA